MSDSLNAIATIGVAAVVAYVGYQIVNSPVGQAVEDAAQVVENVVTGGGQAVDYDPTNPQQRASMLKAFPYVCGADNGSLSPKDGYLWCWNSNHGNYRISTTTGVIETIQTPPQEVKWKQDCLQMGGTVTEEGTNMYCTLRNPDTNAVMFQSVYDLQTRESRVTTVAPPPPPPQDNVCLHIATFKDFDSYMLGVDKDWAKKPSFVKQEVYAVKKLFCKNYK
jgi:hypothetical protein